MSEAEAINYKINLSEAETKRYQSGDKDGFQREAEQQASSRQCDVYLFASDGKTLFCAYPRESVMADPDHLNPAEGGNRASDDYWNQESL